MSAALQLQAIWAASIADAARGIGALELQAKQSGRPGKSPALEAATAGGLAFYRKHTESLLRRYLYASMQVGRSPSLLSAPVGRGWASSRPVRTFEDAVIFVLDVERCLDRLGPLDRQLLSRIVLQEYTQQETAIMLGICVRTVSSRLAKALDKLTDLLLAANLLVLPD
jgi:RNA polymerase sigma factor (sigma-70 family)